MLWLERLMVVDTRSEVSHIKVDDLKYQPLCSIHLDQIAKIENMSFPKPWNEDNLKKELEKDVTFAYGLFSGEVLIAQIFCHLIHDELHILNLAVQAASRGQGIGRNLLARVLRTAKQKGAESAFLEVRVSNLAAKKLYMDHGFKPLGIREKYYQDNQEDALILGAVL